MWEYVSAAITMVFKEIGINQFRYGLENSNKQSVCFYREKGKRV